MFTFKFAEFSEKLQIMSSIKIGRLVEGSDEPFRRTRSNFDVKKASNFYESFNKFAF